MSDESDDAWANELFAARGRDDRPSIDTVAAAALRKRVFDATIAEVSRRRRAGMMRRAVAAFLLFSCGGVCGGVIVANSRSDRPIDIAAGHSASAESREVPERNLPEQAESQFDSDDPALLEVRAAERKIGERARLLRRAADLYLEETVDIAAASRCYGEYLKLIDRDSLERDRSSETWLLASMRTAAD